MENIILNVNSNEFNKISIALFYMVEVIKGSESEKDYRNLIEKLDLQYLER